MGTNNTTLDDLHAGLGEPADDVDDEVTAGGRHQREAAGRHGLDRGCGDRLAGAVEIEERRAGAVLTGWPRLDIAGP